MGFFIVTLQQPRAREVAQRPRPLNLPVVQVKWSQEGDKQVSIRDLALSLCTDPIEILKDILELRANAHVVDQLYKDHGAPQQKELAEKIRNDPDLKVAYDFFSRDPEDRRAADTQRADEAFPNLPFKVHGVRLASSTVEDFRDWRVNVDGRGLFLTLEYSQHVFQVCSANRTTIEWMKADVDAFQAALIKADPFLARLEAAIQRYEGKAKVWSETVGIGKEAIEAGAILATFEATADVYSAQDRRAELLTAHARELGEQLAERIEKSLRDFASAELKALRAIDSNKDFHKALFELLLLWDPTRHYYFHAIAADAVGKPDFEARLFRALRQCAQYLASSPDVADKVGSELTRQLSIIWSEAVDKRGPANEPREKRVERARALLQKLESEGGGISTTLTTIATWCALFASMFGNIEGPPTVWAEALKWYSKQPGFVARLQGDTLIKAALFIGLSNVEQRAVFQQIHAGNIQVAKDLFNNTTWRSTRIYVGFYLLNLAVLIFHVDKLDTKRKRDGDQVAFDRDFIAIYGPLVLDAANVGLVTVTALYSRDLSASIEYSLSKSARVMPKLLASAESNPWRVIASTSFHRVLGVVGLVVSVADLAESSARSDRVENLIKWGMIASSAMIFASLFKVLGFLGPWGVGAAIVATIVQLVYTASFKPKIGISLQGLLSALDSNAFYLRQRPVVIGTTSWIQILGVTVASKPVTIEDLFVKLRDPTGSMSYATTLDQTRLLDYHLAGLPIESLAKMYQLEPDVVQAELRKARYQRTKAHQQSQAVEAHLVSPSGEGTPLIVGALNRITVMVFNHPCNAIWLEWRGPAGDFLDGPTFDATHGVVMLRLDSSTRRREGVQMFAGAFQIKDLPPARGGQVVASLQLKVPKERNPKFPKPDFVLSRALDFPIIDLPPPP